MTEPDKKEKRRRAAIASILRRRNRSRKPRANSGASETSWAEYGPVTFTPGSDRSLAQKFGLFVLFVLGLFIPVVLLFGTMTRWLNGALSWFVESSYNVRFADYHNDFWGVILPFLLYGILLITVFTIALVSVIGITRFIKSIIESR